MTPPLNQQTSYEFGTPNLFDCLQGASGEALDQLSFGVVRLDSSLTVLAYNQPESKLSGLSPEQVIGRDFFTEVAPCTNNKLVAGRFRSDGDLDEVVDYVLAFYMRPVPVQLRLMKRRGAEWRYFCVQPL
ncbi:MAG: PAS domain-containing protein [Haliangiales bacterium]